MQFCFPQRGFYLTGTIVTKGQASLSTVDSNSVPVSLMRQKCNRLKPHNFTKRACFVVGGLLSSQYLLGFNINLVGIPDCCK